jgi:hypothetical protein
MRLHPHGLRVVQRVGHLAASVDHSWAGTAGRRTVTCTAITDTVTANIANEAGYDIAHNIGSG